MSTCCVPDTVDGRSTSVMETTTMVILKMAGGWIPTLRIQDGSMRMETTPHAV